MKSVKPFVVAVLLLASCQSTDPSGSSLEPQAEAPPLQVALDTVMGYSKNPINGEPITTIITSAGNSIPTGRLFRLTSTPFSEQDIPVKVRTIPDPPVNVNIQPRQVAFKGQPSECSYSKYTVSSFQGRDGCTTLVLPGADTIEYHIDTLEVSYIKKPFTAPHPQKIQPMRFMDNASRDIQYLDVGQGLPYSHIRTIYQDRSGIIWFGTEYGLCRYDGTYLTVYAEKEGLNSRNVTSVFEDKTGRLWVGTSKGLCVFDGKNFYQVKSNITALDQEIRTINGSAAGKIVSKTSQNNEHIEFDGKSFLHQYLRSSKKQDQGPLLYLTGNGTTYIHTVSGLIRIMKQSCELFTSDFILKRRISVITQDQNNNDWMLLDRDGLVKFTGSRFLHYTRENNLPEEPYFFIRLDRSNQLWIESRFNGITRFDGRYFTTYDKTNGLPENKIGCSLEDIQGNIWIGTQGGGICKLNTKGFEVLLPQALLDGSRVRPIIADPEGQLWFGTESGRLFSYNGKKLTRYFSREAANLQGFRSLLYDRKRRLWLGENGGYGFYRLEEGQLNYYKSQKFGHSTFAIFEDSLSRIWFGTYNNGLLCLDSSGYSYYNKSNGFPSNMVYAVSQDRKGNLWIGTNGAGLIRFDGKNFTCYSEKEGCFTKNIYAITIDKKDQVWLGTEGAGLCRFDGKTFTYYSTGQGLAFHTIWSIKEDRAGRIWAGTDNGLSVLIPKQTTTSTYPEYSIFSYGLLDGLKATDFNLNSVAIDPQNRIWWGTGRDVMSLDLNTTFPADTPKNLSLTHLEVNDQPYPIRESVQPDNRQQEAELPLPRAGLMKQLELQHFQNHIRFYFAATEWNAPQKIRYSYRLLGLDPNWGTPSSETTVDYRNLNPGSYTFEVRALGTSQVWTNPVSLKLAIIPAWWQTWWFRTSILLLVIGLSVNITRSLYRIRLRQQRLILEKERAVQLERQRISAEMHDDIGAGLSGVKLLTELTRRKLKEGDVLYEVDRIHESVGDLSARMKEVIWSLNTKNDSLTSLIGFLQNQSRMQFEHYPGNFEVLIEDPIPDLQISGDKRRHIYLLVKEALHNALKHSGASHIRLQIVCRQKLLITVADNGKGLNADSAGEGNGFNNMKDRIKQLNGTMQLNTGNGLTLTFNIPLS